ncbi:MAG: hypothetical protein Kow00114_19220 [Kiloniellaceae bacterium]
MRCVQARSTCLAAGLLAAALLPCAAAPLAPAWVAPARAALAWAERPDDEVYIFGLRLDRYVLTEGLVVFYDGDEAFAPLGALAELLEFPIAVDPARGTADGWFLNDDRRFQLDLAALTVQLSGRRLDIDPGAVERHPDDIYVALEELERWFPVALELSFGDLAIDVVALEPLPLQQRIAREERWRHLRRSAGDEGLETVGPEEPWFDWPFVDTSIEVSGRRQPEETHSRGRLTTTVAGIVGGLDAEMTAVTDSDQRIPNFRVRVGRRSLDRGLLGPLDASEYALGDVTTPDLPLVAENAVGRGFEVSSYDLDRLEQTNRVTLRGELPVGWEVEVYRNGELIDFKTESDSGNGRYEFANLPTLAGLNEFRLVFFGPQGQTREQVERYFVTPEFAEPGRTDFRFAFNQRNRDLIEFDDRVSTQPDDGENRFVLQAEHGISETLSFGGGLASLSVDGARRFYAGVNLQASVFGALGQLDAALADDGGLALGGRLQTRIGSWSLYGEQSFFDGFHSEQTDNSPVSGHLRSRTALRLNGHLPDIGFGHQPLSAAITHDVAEDGDWQTSVFGRVSAVVRPLNFALSSTTRLRAAGETVSDARLLVGTLLGDFRLRGEVGIDVAPRTAFDQVTLSADWRIDQDFGARVGLRHVGGEDPVAGATLGLNYQFEHFAVGLSVDGDDRGEYNARLGLSFSFGRDPGAGRMEVRARPFARQGAVSAQVFLDRDNDGVFDPDEEPIANAGFSGPRLPRDVRTGEDGRSFIVGLVPYRETEIALNEATLEDPFWAAGRRPVRVVTRPGSATTLLFPVVETGEVDGTVMVTGAGGGAPRPGGGLRVFLHDDTGRLVAETTTAYDGYFFLGRIPYGRYLLVMDDGQLRALGYAAVPPRRLAIGAEEPFIVGQDFEVAAEPLVTAAGRSTTEQTD